MRLRAAAAFVLVVMAIAIALTGGFRGSILGVAVSAHRPFVAAIAAWALLFLGLGNAGRLRLDGRLERMRAFVRRHAALCAAAVATATLLVTLRFGAFVAAGADPYGYVSQALLWADGNPVQVQSSLALDAPWPEADASFCPLGYKPSRIRGLIVPTYSIGLPLQMAMFARGFGAAGVWWVVPLLGAALVWWTYGLAHRLCASAESAVVATLLAASSPILLFQLMQPMSDVPAAAWWIVSLTAALDAPLWASLGSGLCASLAILTRPNLLPLVVPLSASLSFRQPRRLAPARIALFAAGLVPGVALTAAANYVLFGSPLTSGYGTLAETYHLVNLPANVARYTGWLWESQTPFALAGFLPLVSRRMRHLGVAPAFVLVLFGCYIFYLSFDHWTYLRFLLPGVPVLLVSGVAAAEALSGSVSRFAQTVTLAFLVLVLPPTYVGFARGGDAFALRRLFGDRYVASAQAFGERVDGPAAVLCLLQSGSLRFYGRQTTLRYDLVPMDRWDQVVEYLRRRRLEPYVVLEATENADFAARFPRASDALVDSSKATVLDPLRLVRAYCPLAR